MNPIRRIYTFFHKNLLTKTMAIGVVLALMGTSGDTMLLTTIGLLIFTGLTAYDVQKMKVLYLQCEDEALRERLSVYSAFELYLDFINIFMYI